MKYKPKNKAELSKLVSNHKITLGDIDTSLITDMSYIFNYEEASNRDFSGIESWDVSNVTNMKRMFAHCLNFNENINFWDVSKVKDAEGMFFGCESFNQPLDRWDVSSLEIAREMFGYCICFNQPLDMWNVENLTNVYSMFEYCESFNQPLNNWKIDKINYFGDMFKECKSLMQNFSCWVKDDDSADSIICELAHDIGIESFKEHFKKIEFSANKYRPKRKWELKLLVLDENIKLDSIDTSKITDMSDLFGNLYGKKRKDFSGIETWNVSNVENMESMFCFCEKFNEPIGCWDVAKVTNMGDMFLSCHSFNQGLENWDVSNVTDMNGMFYGCYKFNQKLDKWNVSKVIKFYNMFCDCYEFNQPLNNWDVSSAEALFDMFANCIFFNQPLDKWELKNGDDADGMFINCVNLKQDFSSWEKFYRRLDYEMMFSGCNSMTQELVPWYGKIEPLTNYTLLRMHSGNQEFLKYFVFNRPKNKAELQALVKDENIKLYDIDTSAITDMSHLFEGDFRQDYSGVEYWYVSNVENTEAMFKNCVNFNLDVYRWNSSKIKNMREMFSGCINFSERPCYIKSAEVDITDIFKGCNNLPTRYKDLVLKIKYDKIPKSKAYLG